MQRFAISKTLAKADSRLSEIKTCEERTAEDERDVLNFRAETEEESRLRRIAEETFQQLRLEAKCNAIKVGTAKVPLQARWERKQCK